MTTESKHTCWNCGCNPNKERRERIATAILAVMNTANQTASTPQEMADAALQQADALIAELDKESK